MNIMLISRVHATSTTPAYFEILPLKGEAVHFRTGNYNFVAAPAESLFSELYGFVNKFLCDLSVYDQGVLHYLYASVKDILGKAKADNISELIGAIKTTILTAVNAINLEEKIWEYCRNNNSLDESYPDLSKAGTLPHHVAERTFYKRDYVNITCVSFLAKMFAPIWGELYALLDEFGFSIEESDEMILNTVYDLFSRGQYTDSFSKLWFSIDAAVEKHRKFFDGHNQVMSAEILRKANIDDQMFNYINLSHIITQRMVKFDPIGNDDNPERNIIKYVLDGLKRTSHKILKDLRVELMPHQPEKK